jgi:SAM-dependent methyltransferase
MGLLNLRTPPSNKHSLGSPTSNGNGTANGAAHAAAALARPANGSVGYLERVFHATEEENKRTILSMLPTDLGGGMLDLGTHEGEFTLRVAEHVGATRVAGIELIQAHAAVAQARGIDVINGDLDGGFPIDSESFDFVHANQVIEHVRRTDRFLSEVRRVLVPDGLAMVSTNNLSGWHNVLSLALGFQPTPAHVSDEVVVGNPLDPLAGQPHVDLGRTHLRIFTRRALRDLCAYHGLEALSIRTVGYYPLPPRLGRMAARIDPLHGAFLIGLFRRTR